MQGAKNLDVNAVQLIYVAAAAAPAATTAVMMMMVMMVSPYHNFYGIKPEFKPQSRRKLVS